MGFYNHILRVFDVVKENFKHFFQLLYAVRDIYIPVVLEMMEELNKYGWILIHWWPYWQGSTVFTSCFR